MADSVGAAIEAATRRLAEAGVDSPMLDAQLLMAFVVGCSRLDVIAHPERSLCADERVQYESVIARCASRFPLAYILGRREFFGIDVMVAPGVLIPRPETELLVEECLKRLSGKIGPIIADIGAGSGAIAVALAAKLPDARVYATEICADALKVASANAEKHGLSDRVILMEGDLLQPLNEIGLVFDAIVSNPPYIPSKDIEDLEPEVRLHEPRLALDGGEDGLDVYRRLFPEAWGLIKTGGFVAVEIGVGEADGIREIANNAGYCRIEVSRDLAGIERVVVAYK